MVTKNATGYPVALKKKGRDTGEILSLSLPDDSGQHTILYH